MRSLEVIHLFILALTLISIPILRRKPPRRLRFLPTLPALVMLLQLVIEGYRWQMFPAYVLSALVFLGWLPAMIRGYQSGVTIRRRKSTDGLVVLACLFGLFMVWITVELCVQMPVFTMPVSHGQYAVGTRTFLLVDESRPDGESPLGSGFRTMSIQAWYPARLTGDDEHTTYL